MTDTMINEFMAADILADLGITEDPAYVKTAAKRDPILFERIYRAVEERNREEIRQRLDAVKDPALAGTVRDLINDGIAVCRGLFADEEFLERARRYVSQTAVAARATLRRNGASQFYDPANDLLYAWNEPAESDAPVGLPVFGRTRAMWNSASSHGGNDELRRIAEDPFLSSVLHVYGGRSPESTYVIAEELVPSLEGQDWHIDRWIEQIKAMVLLVDVDMSNGPLALKKGTHVNRSKETWKTIYEYYSIGQPYSYMSREVAKLISGETVYGTGKAGDVFFFDTLAIHSGTRCLLGNRLNCVVYPVAQSYKVQALRAILCR